MLGRVGQHADRTSRSDRHCARTDIVVDGPYGPKLECMSSTGVKSLCETGELQVPPLRYAPVGMTRLRAEALPGQPLSLKNATLTLSSRPERSAVEGPAVRQF